MPVANLPAVPPFIGTLTLSSLPAHPDVLLLDVHYDETQYSPSLFDTLNIALPARLRKAVDKRRAEYLASRYALQQALTTLGHTQFILHNDEHRAPLWPDGVRGSLSHTHRRICALLTHRQDLLPGIDCERIMTAPRAREMARPIVSPAEAGLLARSTLSFACALTVVFSAKESLYKAVWPQLRQFMDFGAAEVIGWQTAPHRLTLRLTHRYSAEFYAGREFVAEATIQPDMVMTWVIGVQSR